jgi:UDPglucose 6-dehydrogenase
MSRSSAELTKYAANTMLACKISFINQMSQLAQAFDADIDHIAKGMALDHRIGSSFLQAGIGYGGSCFSKDLQALIQTFKSVAIDSSFIEAIDQINHQQKQWVIKQLRHHFKDELHGLRIGIWGLAFKPGTDDMREASSLVAIEALIDAGVHLIVYDPEATTNAQKILSDYNQIIWAKSSEQVLEYGLDALILMTEWQEFTQYPLLKLKKQLNNSPLFDGRNCYELAKIAAAQFSYYYSVGRPPILNVSSAAVRDKVLQKCM